MNAMPTWLLFIIAFVIGAGLTLLSTVIWIQGNCANVLGALVCK